MPITWNSQRMSTGLSDLDEQHKEWLRIADDFDVALAERKGIAKLRETLDRVMNYAETHFRLEEDYMARYHCPEAENNRTAHEQFRQRYRSLAQRIKTHGANVADAVELDFALSRWIAEHICAIDSKLRLAIQKRAEELSRPPQS
jgi:hemerythrin